MKPKISLIRDETLKTLELRLPAVSYDTLMENRVSMMVSLKAAEYFALGALSVEMGLSTDEIMYCGFRILEASVEDEDVRRDCVRMVKTRR